MPLCLWDSPGKSIGVGCHFLLQGIYLTQGLNPHLLYLLQWQADSLSLVPSGKPIIGQKHHLLLKQEEEIISIQWGWETVQSRDRLRNLVGGLEGSQTQVFSDCCEKGGSAPDNISSQSTAEGVQWLIWKPLSCSKCGPGGMLRLWCRKCPGGQVSV